MTAYYYGNGSSGPLAISSPRAEDAANGFEGITALASSGQGDVTVSSGATFSAGDWVFLYQAQGTGAGLYEFAKVSSISTNVLTMAGALSNSYQSSGAQAIKVAQYSSVTLNSGAVWEATAWNGTKGGVLVAMVSGSVTVNAGASISVDSMGFPGGNAPFPTGLQGDSPTGAGAASASANGAAGGGGAGTASGGGAGHSSSGTAGSLGFGIDGTIGDAGGTAGAADLQNGSMALGSGGGGGSRTVLAGSGGGHGGQGGGMVLIVSGGGISLSSAASVTSAGEGGGAGNTTSGSTCAGGGGGSGGSMRLLTPGTLALGSGIVSAAGGTGGAMASGSAAGGNASAGRIATIASASVTGTSSPSIDASSSDTVTGTDPFQAVPIGSFLFNFI